MRADLHIHSTFSDGTWPPDEIFRRARESGMDVVSITDHDSIAWTKGTDTHGMPFIPGIEINADCGFEVHVLGYCFDLCDGALNDFLSGLQERRRQRCVKIVERLNELGVDVSLEDVSRYSSGEAVGRPHVARALVAKGYCADVSAAFGEYLSEGAKAYVDSVWPGPEEAVRVIKRSGGLSVLAHPGFIPADKLNALLPKLVCAGLGGIEAYYPTHTQAQLRHFTRLAQELGLIVTVGSDCHGDIRDGFIGAETRTSPFLERGVGVILSMAGVNI